MSAIVELRQVTSIRWECALYEASDDSLVLKVMFSEGVYKIDVARFFRVKLTADSDRQAAALIELAARIRSFYPNDSYPELREADLKIVQ